MTAAAVAIAAVAVIVFAAGCGGVYDEAAPATPAPNAGDVPPPNGDRISAGHGGQKPVGEEPLEPPPSNPIDELLSGMDAAEKIGQLMFIGIDGYDLSPEEEQLIRDRRPGGIIFFRRNIESREQVMDLIRALERAGTGAVPLFLGVDQEGGPVSRVPAEFSPLPSNAAVGARGDAGLADRFGRLLAGQVRALGLNVNFAPVLDINTVPGNPAVGSRSFGGDARLVADMGRAVLTGMAEEGVIPVVKHFPGHGAAAADSHQELPVSPKPEEELAASDLVPFRGAIDAGVPAVMMAHIVYPAVDPDFPASMSPVIIDTMLRQEMGFDGLIITDDLTMGAVTDSRHPPAAAVEAVKAGADMVMIAHGGAPLADASFTALKEAVETGVISAGRLDDAVRRILALKINYGLYCPPGGVDQSGGIPPCPRPRPAVDLELLNEAVDDLAREIATR